MTLLLLLFSQSSPGLEFLNIGVDGRVMALGGACATIKSPGGIYFNPAISGEYRVKNFSSSYSRYLLGSNMGLFSGIIPLGEDRTLGLGIKALYIDRIEERSIDDPWNYSYYTSLFLVLNSSFSMKFNNLLWGIGLNFSEMKIERTNGMGAFINTGLKYNGEYYHLGLSLSNLGMKILNTSLPITLRAGGSFKILDGKIIPVADLTYTIKKGISGNIGLEINPVDLISLRIGYNPEIASGDLMRGITLGFGLNTGNFVVDYAAATGSVLGITHYFTISYGFGRKKEKVVTVVHETFSKERMMSDKLVEQGISYYREGKYKEALNYFDLSLIWNPNNTNAKKWMKKIQSVINSQKIAEFIKLGKEKMNSKDYLNAAFYFNKALSIDSTNQEALTLKRKVENLLKTGMKTSTKRDMEIALKYYRNGDYLRAISIWSELLRKEPGNTRIKNYINSAKKKMTDEISSGLRKIDGYILRGKLKSASYLVNKLLKKYRTNKDLLSKREKVNSIIKKQVKFYIDKGKEAYNNGKLQEAEKNFQKVLEYEPGNKTALSYLEKIGKKTVKGKKNEADRYYILGIEAYTQNNYELAIKYWEKTLKIYPGYPNAKENIERAKLKLKELQKPD